MIREVRLVLSTAIILTVLSSYAGPAQPARVFFLGALKADPTQQCVLLHTTFNYDYMLDNYGAFEIGDSVAVRADSEEQCTCSGGGIYLCLHGNTIAPIGNVDCGCGVLRAAEYGCMSMFSEDYGSFLLDSHDGFADGDTVRVWGRLSLEACGCISECACEHCVYHARLFACPDTGQAIQPTSWGRLRMLFR
jgi:hypothetical protein